jgi:hypothetical protein
MLTQGSEARKMHEVWASDSIFMDSLLIAPGVPSLSGRQLADPDREAWAEVDPTLTHEVNWNRGGSFITFDWTDAPELTFVNPSPDAIVISGSPCTLAERMPELGDIVASHRLDLSCLSEVESFTWGDSERWVYAVTPSASGG